MSPSLPLHSLAGAVNLHILVIFPIPPPHELDQYLHLLCPCAQFIKGAIWDIFHSGSLPPTNLFLHWPHTRSLQGLLHQWPLPPSLPDSPILHPCNPPIHSMVEPFQHFQYRIHHYLTITPVNHHGLNHCLVHHHPFPHRLSRIHKHLFHHPPPPLRLPQISV